ncbi:hypothetical protein BWZ31_12715, partial [Neisseria meningitidis]
MDAHLGYAHSDRTAKAQLGTPDGGNHRNAGLQAEMDAHLGYAHSDRTAKAQLGTPDGGNHRN